MAAHQSRGDVDAFTTLHTADATAQDEITIYFTNTGGLRRDSGIWRTTARTQHEIHCSPARRSWVSPHPVDHPLVVKASPPRPTSSSPSASSTASCRTKCSTAFRQTLAHAARRTRRSADCDPARRARPSAHRCRGRRRDCCDGCRRHWLGPIVPGLQYFRGKAGTATLTIPRSREVRQAFRYPPMPSPTPRCKHLGHVTHPGRKTAGAGDPEECTLSRSWISSAARTGDILYRGASPWARLAPARRETF